MFIAFRILPCHAYRMCFLHTIAWSHVIGEIWRIRRGHCEARKIRFLPSLQESRKYRVYVPDRSTMMLEPFMKTQINPAKQKWQRVTNETVPMGTYLLFGKGCAHQFKDDLISTIAVPPTPVAPHSFLIAHT